MTFDTHGRTMMGVTPEKAVTTLASFCATAIGGNCGNGPEEIITVIEKMHATAPDALLVAKANAGIPQLVGGKPVYRAHASGHGRVRRQSLRSWRTDYRGLLWQHSRPYPGDCRCLATDEPTGVKTALIVCGALAREVLALKEKHGWEVDVLGVPALLHNAPERLPVAILKRIRQARQDYQRVFVVYGDCGTGGLLDQPAVPCLSTSTDGLPVRAVLNTTAISLVADKPSRPGMGPTKSIRFTVDYIPS